MKKNANKKVRNAQIRVYDNIKFKSALEVNVYKALTSAGFKPRYEPNTYTLWTGFKSVVPFYDKDKKSGNLILQTKKMIDIKYTPDFIFLHNGWQIIIEAKGKENDVFYIKKKLFRQLLDSYVKQGQKIIYFEVYNLKHIQQAITIIKEL